MAGGLVKYRHLSRDSSARVALLRGLVTQLIANEQIHTTYAKAKEAQRLAEKLLTLARKGTEPARRSAQGILYTPDKYLPKLFGELRDRYMERGRGCTRVVRTEPKNPYDQGESAILELVDGPRDTRFMMTAKAVARDRQNRRSPTLITQKNVNKVTRYRGTGPFELMVQRFTKRWASNNPEEDGLEVPEISSSHELEAEKMAARETQASERYTKATKDSQILQPNEKTPTERPQDRS